MGDQESIAEIVNLARIYYDRQWMFATAGNLSVRSTIESQFWVTASGKNKGKLLESDFVCVDVESLAQIKNSLSGDNSQNRPSAESSIHAKIYSHLPSANSVLHVHTLASNLLKYDLTPEEGYRLVPIPNIEIIKAFGIWNEKPNLNMAVFYNFGTVQQIADQVAIFLAKYSDYQLPFLLVEEHGPTVWGKNIDEANRHLEATAFLFNVMKEMKR